jgi:hypothetical protein
MNSSLRFPTNWVVYSKSFPLQPVVESPVVESPVVESPVVESPVVESPVSETQVSETPVSETQVSETPVVVDTTFVLEYFTTKPDEFTVPKKYGKFMEEYDNENKTNYYLSRLQLNHGQLACTNQIENGLIVNVTSSTNKKNKLTLTLILPYGSYRKHTKNTKSTSVHTLNQVYDIVQPRNKPVVEEKGKNRKHHHEEHNDEVTQ